VPLDAGTRIRQWLERAHELARGYSWSGGQKGGKEGTKGTEGGAAEAPKRDDLIKRLRHEVAEAVLPAWDMPSVMRKRTDVEAREVQVGGGPSELVTVVRLSCAPVMPSTHHLLTLPMYLIRSCTQMRYALHTIDSVGFWLK
jgi:hypothetical protein